MTQHGRNIERIIDQIQSSFDGSAAFGTPLRRALDGVDAAAATARPLPDTHSILELVVHAGTWIDAARRRIQGEIVEITTEEDWQDVTDKNWDAAVEELVHAHSRLLDVVARMTPDSLDQPVAGKPYTVLQFLQSIAHHNAYHAGQIMILKKG